eukprot:CAMPEP_0206241312 /NCGR_PEP_ID=MMETSP0047_2-20121206/16425_1 /ASSEMBLY_ACC=CAM_ASM_000192 /TAXON_ID=195065 /ORGANISM="Chroomonas mesostigmatica_cf, Strain CCMP1168" /LENGTH=536 /DNA_ID=CAMNT_0053666193 /DNA_START=88 /DNA_END=1699 /DNA_ORIENTATION=-
MGRAGQDLSETDPDQDPPNALPRSLSGRGEVGAAEGHEDTHSTTPSHQQLLRAPLDVALHQDCAQVLEGRALVLPILDHLHVVKRPEHHVRPRAHGHALGARSAHLAAGAEGGFHDLPCGCLLAPHRHHAVARVLALLGLGLVVLDVGVRVVPPCRDADDEGEGHEEEAVGEAEQHLPVGQVPLRQRPQRRGQVRHAPRARGVARNVPRVRVGKRARDLSVQLAGARRRQVTPPVVLHARPPPQELQQADPVFPSDLPVVEPKVAPPRHEGHVEPHDQVDDREDPPEDAEARRLERLAREAHSVHSHAPVVGPVDAHYGADPRACRFHHLPVLIAEGLRHEEVLEVSCCWGPERVGDQMHGGVLPPLLEQALLHPPEPGVSWLQAAVRRRVVHHAALQLVEALNGPVPDRRDAPAPQPNEPRTWEPRCEGLPELNRDPHAEQPIDKDESRTRTRRQVLEQVLRGVRRGGHQVQRVAAADRDRSPQGGRLAAEGERDSPPRERVRGICPISSPWPGPFAPGDGASSIWADTEAHRAP